MHVPAYCPVVVGFHAEENNGVPVEVKKTIAIESMPIIIPEDIEDMGIELVVELAIAIPDIVAVGGTDIDMVMAIPSMLEVIPMTLGLEFIFMLSSLRVGFLYRDTICGCAKRLKVSLGGI